MKKTPEGRPPGPEAKRPRTCQEILRGTATRFKSLDREVDEALLEALRTRNLEKHDRLIRERAGLIRDLPDTLEEATDRVHFDSDAMDTIRFFAGEAERFMSQGEAGLLGMRALLTRRGSREGDPNELERLIERLYPPPQENPE